MDSARGQWFLYEMLRIKMTYERRWSAGFRFLNVAQSLKERQKNQAVLYKNKKPKMLSSPRFSLMQQCTIHNLYKRKHPDRSETRRKSFESSEIKIKMKSKLSKNAQNLFILNAVQSIDMTIEATRADSWIMMDILQIPLCIQNFQAFARNNSQTKTESVTKIKLRKKMGKPQMQWVE